MYNSWYFVKELAKNLNRELQGAIFQTPFTYKKNEVYIPFSGHDEFQCLHMVIKNPVPYFMTEANVPKQRQVVKILKHLTGCVIDEIRFHKSDRQILFVLNNGNRFLLVQIYGINGNIYFLDENFEIADNYKNRKNSELPDRSDFTDTEPECVEVNWIQYFHEYEDKTLFQFLKLLPYKFFSENLREEICFRLNVDKNLLIYNLSDIEKNSLIALIDKILAQLKSPEYYFYLTEMPILSLIEFDFLHESGEQTDDFFDLLRKFVSNSFRDFSFVNTKKSLMGKIGSYYEILTKRLSKSEKSLAELPDSQSYREFGDAILINVHQIKRGQTSIQLQSYLDPEKTLSITLDPKLNPSQNADQYFKRAHKIEGARKELTSSIQQLSQEKEKIQSLITRLENSESYDEIKAIEAEVPSEVFQQSLRSETNVRVPYRRFYYNGWEILVGKAAKDNDELTFKVASKMDFWLHAYQVSGSHVIVKNPQKKENLPEEILYHAAGIAAFFSKNKHSGVVPVNYTKRKYVWKRKAMAPGQVFINFEKTVIVEPLDPTG